VSTRVTPPSDESSAYTCTWSIPSGSRKVARRMPGSSSSTGRDDTGRDSTAMDASGGGPDARPRCVGESVLLGVAEQVAERLPGLSLELLQDLLVDDEVVRRRRVDLDARVEERVDDVLHARQRVHQTLTGRVRARRLQRLHE